MPDVQLPPPPLSSQSMADLMCNLMVFCQGENEQGRAFWAYICIKPSMARAFREARESGFFNLEDYGTIVEYGESEEVPPQARDRMARYYGAADNYEQQLLDTVENL